MTGNAAGVKKGLPRKHNCAGDGAFGKGLISEEEGELKVGGEENRGEGIESLAQRAPQVRPQQHYQGAAVCWERFLHIRSIKVLLVESDDSTRHIVAALLRNCNYEVIEAANGVQAWKVLADLTNHVDLVLTELVMPCLSGIGLLCKIMSHKTRKNVPVIMMSSHDSMGLVFKCLSKGAVDFLVKPIRKNELKNLWQHVWRRCHSSSGSGSESGTQSQKSIHSEGSEMSHNLSVSNEAENDRSKELNNIDGSDDGSGAQSSWTKHPPEADTSRAASPLDQVVACPEGTHVRYKRPNSETSGKQRVHGAARRDSREEAQFVKTEVQIIPQQATSLDPINLTASLIPTQTRGLHQDLQVQHRHYDHYQKSEVEIKDKSLFRKSATIVPHCDPSNAIGVPGDGEPGNEWLNGRGCLTNCESVVEKGNRFSRNAGLIKGKSVVGSGGRSCSGDACVAGCKTRKNQNKFPQRDADSSKFRQRRKDRWFKKKVHHQSRKVAAEQRLRVLREFPGPAGNDK